MENLDLLIGIGDLHGMKEAFFYLLSKLDSQYKIFSWKNRLREGVKIVTTGDYIDRNKGGIKIIETIKKMQKKTPEQIISLMGNHEIMALKCLDYAREVNEKYPENPYKYCSCDHGSNGGNNFVSEFDPKNQLNALKHYIERMKREGDIGSWLRNLFPYKFEEINGKKVLFTHADIPVELWNPEKLKEYLEKYSQTIRTSTGPGCSEAKYGSIDSPLWERIFLTLNNSDFKGMINSLGVDYLVTGHTPTYDNKIKVYADCVFDIDVGMWYDENQDPVAIVFKKDGVYEFNANKGERVLGKY